MKYNTDKIKNLNPLSVWLDKYGIETDKTGFARCPFHQEKTASLKVYSDGTYHCFGCGAHGDVIAFVMRIQNITFTEACQLLDGDITYSEQRRIERNKRQRQRIANKKEKAVMSYWTAFDVWKDNEDTIELFKPIGPAAVPNALFLEALSMRGKLEYNLNLAEAVYLQRGEVSV